MTFDIAVFEKLYYWLATLTSWAASLNLSTSEIGLDNFRCRRVNKNAVLVWTVGEAGDKRRVFRIIRVSVHAILELG